MQPYLFHLHALSALHCGTGQATGVVDQPIARARATNLPIVPGSSIRGVLREELTTSSPNDVATLFGPEATKLTNDINNNTKEIFAGALAIGDAHLLILPMRCLAGIVCYATAPFVLKRYAQDLTRASITDIPNIPIPHDDSAYIAAGSVNKSERNLVLEDIDLIAEYKSAATQWAEKIAQHIYPQDTTAQDDLKQRFAILPDNVFNFLAETATEVRARIAIDHETGIVKEGALWYEENLPAESILWGIYALSNSMNTKDSRTAAQLKDRLPKSGSLLQLGGNASVGRGLMRFLR